jgi:hypothetical protein
MSWLAQLVNVLNVFRKTQSTESPISTVSTIPAEPVDGLTTSDSTSGGPISNQEAGNRALHRKWRKLASKFPESAISQSDRWGMLTQFYTEGCVCRCLACRLGFTTWGEGRKHECEQEKDFRRITQRRIPRPNANFRRVTRPSRPQKAGPGSATAGDSSDRPGIAPDGVGVVADSSKPSSGRSRRNKRRQRDSSGTSSSSESSSQGAVRDQGPDAGIDSDREADTAP